MMLFFHHGVTFAFHLLGAFFFFNKKKATKGKKNTFGQTADKGKT